MIKLVQNFSHKSTTSVSPSLMNTLVAKWANQILLIMGYSQSLKSTVRYTSQNIRFLWKDLHQPLYIVQALSLYPPSLSSVDFHTQYGRRVVLATKEVTMGTKVSKPPATLGATWELWRWVSKPHLRWYINLTYCVSHCVLLCHTVSHRITVLGEHCVTTSNNDTSSQGCQL